MNQRNQCPQLFVVHPLGCPRSHVPTGLKSILKGGQQTAWNRRGRTQRAQRDAEFRREDIGKEHRPGRPGLAKFDSLVAQVSKPAVSPTSKSADYSNAGRVLRVLQPAGLETCATPQIRRNASLPHLEEEARFEGRVVSANLWVPLCPLRWSGRISGSGASQFLASGRGRPPNPQPRTATLRSAGVLACEFRHRLDACSEIEMLPQARSDHFLFVNRPTF